ncbi:hypothetical protein Bca101_036817 [Brassica carinata]
MGDESGKTDSGEVEKVDFEDVELLIDLKKKAKGKKRKATLLMQRANPPRETSRKSSVPEAVPSKTPTASASVGGSKAKLSRKTANAKLLAEQSASRPKPSRKPSSPDKGYVPPHQSLRPAGKFQIIHLGAIACPGEPVDVEEAKIALDGALVSIQQLAAAMEALTSVVSHIAQMVLEKYPKLKRGRLKMQRSSGHSDTDSSTTTNAAESTTMSAYADEQDEVRIET